MLPVRPRPTGSVTGAPLARRLPILLLALGVVWVSAQAQAGPGPAPPSAGCPVPSPALAPGCPPPCELGRPGVPEKPPRPATGPESVRSFIDSLSSTDAGFEVIVGQGRILTLKESLAVKGKIEPLVAVGDPSVADITPVSPRQIRVLGLRTGVTDLSITTADGRTYNFEVRVVADLDVLRARLRCLFPDATLKLAALRDHVVVEGQARDTPQVGRIMETIRAYLLSVQVSQSRQVRGTTAGGRTDRDRPREAPKPKEVDPPVPPVPGDGLVGPDRGAPEVQATIAPPQIINLIRVPGPQQVLLKVRVAELNRTALRQIGADFLAIDPDTGAIVGTQIGGASVAATATAAGRALTGVATSSVSPSTTAFGIFEEGNFAVLLSALRRNAMLKILAEPNLVAMNGHQASFLAGGEFPVPVSQAGGGGAAPTVTVQFKEFGVRLGFVPYILDGDVIRLTVDPEVSTIDFAIGTVLVPGGTPVPGLNTRKAHTVVEMRQGQTLAIAGLLQLAMDGTTSRIPGLGDLPILGPFFSNTTNNRIEKELIVLVTPYLVDPANPEQVPPLPGDEVKTPNDLEFYLLNRIEGRTGIDFRSTTDYPDFLRCLYRMHKDNVRGPFGHCE
jgi:pilus assembly protein CpaC